MKSVKFTLIAVLSIGLTSRIQANTFGSVEPIANPAVLDTSALAVNRWPCGRHLHGSSCNAASSTR